MLLGAWLVSLVTAPNSGRRLRSRDSTWVLYLLLGLTAFATQIATQAMTRSRMGAALMLVALAAVVALSLKARGTDENKAGSTRIIVGVSLFGLFMISQYALLAALDRFLGTDPLKDGRIAFARNTIEAARDFMPWGGGVGTFVSIYPIYEKIPDLMSDSFANRAHNDILEIWLETGIFGPVLLAGFAIWLVTRAFHLWRDREWTGLLLDLQLARAAAVILLLLLVHSFVDYPLRTGALMVLAGFCCALLVPPILRNADDGLETVLSASAARREASRPLQPVTIAPSLAGRLPGAPPQAMESDSLGTAPSRTTWPGTAWPGVGPTEPRDAEPPRHADAAAGWPQAQESGPEPPPALRDRVGEAHWPQDWEKPADRDPRRVRPAVSPGSAGPVKEPTSKK